jgi:hypothetical protein
VVRSQHIRNPSQECYSYVNSFGLFVPIPKPHSINRANVCYLFNNVISTGDHTGSTQTAMYEKLKQEWKKPSSPNPEQ